MQLLTLDEILTAIAGQICHPLDPDLVFSGNQVITDSRQPGTNMLFVPLKGERFDGHQYIPQAFENGAVLAICEYSYYEQNQEELDTYPLILVENTLLAYQHLARHWRRKLAPIVIGITGSSGKTSTKEILAALLSHSYQVHKTQMNFNNQVGVPKTLLQLTPEHEVCILEMAMRARGEIRELAEIGEPDVGIITNIGTAHIGELDAIENIALAKWELAENLALRQGFVIIPDNDSHLPAFPRTGGFQTHSDSSLQKIIRCGTLETADIQMIKRELLETGQIIHWHSSKGNEGQITLNIPGQHQAQNLLLCLGAAQAIDCHLPPELLLEVPILFGRSQLIKTSTGTQIINDAYNANPDSMRASLRALAEMPAKGRKIGVLSYMGELGAEEAKYHYELGRFCQQIPLDLLCVVGEAALPIAEGAQGASFEILACISAQDALDKLKRLLKPEDIVLFKASRSAHLESIIQPLLDGV